MVPQRKLAGLSLLSDTMHLLFRLICAAAFVAAGTGMAQAAEPTSSFAGRVVDRQQMQVGRYTTALAKPARTVSRPLEVFVQISYPRQTVRTVGDAVDHTLVRTGWRLVQRSSLSADAARFLDLPLPESQRSLGPYRVREVLQVLLGETWVWQQDPVRRLLWFTMAPSMAALTESGKGAGAPSSTSASPPGMAGQVGAEPPAATTDAPPPSAMPEAGDGVPQ